jgi:hypothetical protein
MTAPSEVVRVLHRMGRHERCHELAFLLVSCEYDGWVSRFRELYTYCGRSTFGDPTIKVPLFLQNQNYEILSPHPLPETDVGGVPHLAGGH